MLINLSMLSYLYKHKSIIKGKKSTFDDFPHNYQQI